jgi:hypothetical protein
MKVELIYFDAGNGHRRAAFALLDALKSRNLGWDARAVNLQELLDDIDIARKLTGMRMQDVYNAILRKGLTFMAPQSLKLLHGLIRATHGEQVKTLKRHWAEERPDMVVSLIPNFNRALFESLRAVSSDAPFVTILTDLADYPPHFWIERQEQYLICGTPKAAEQARALGHDAKRIFLASGVILAREFHEREAWDADAERRRIGLRPGAPTGLVLFGGNGSRSMRTIARAMMPSPLGVQLIFICGNNRELAADLTALSQGRPWFVEGFTREVPRYMAMSDFFIGKPGPGSVSEAIQMGLPAIVECNSRTLPQERYNAAWIRDNGFGAVVKNFSTVERAVAEMLEPGRLEEIRARCARMTNRALYEIPGMLELIAGATAATGSTGTSELPECVDAIPGSARATQNHAARVT